MEVWRKKGREGRTERGNGLIRAIRWERCREESNSVKSKREWEAQMERAATILVHDEIICMRSTACYS